MSIRGTRSRIHLLQMHYRDRRWMEWGGGERWWFNNNEIKDPVFLRRCKYDHPLSFYIYFFNRFFFYLPTIVNTTVTENPELLRADTKLIRIILLCSARTNIKYVIFTADVHTIDNHTEKNIYTYTSFIILLYWRR